MKEYPQYLHRQGQGDSDSHIWDSSHCGSCKMRMRSVVILIIATFNCYCFIFQIFQGWPINKLVHRRGVQADIDRPNSLSYHSVANASAQLDVSGANVTSAASNTNLDVIMSNNMSSGVRSNASTITSVSLVNVSRDRSILSDLKSNVTTMAFASSNLNTSSIGNISSNVTSSLSTIQSGTSQLNASGDDSSSSDIVGNETTLLPNFVKSYNENNVLSDLVNSPSNAPPDLCTIVNSQQATNTGNQTCDIYRGKWVPDTLPPLYTNETCRHIIFDNQDCLANGRPDREYLQWRWKPKGCELPRFDSRSFLELMRGKRMLFAGDSIARNHMQSLLCTLVQVETPQELGLGQWAFRSYNFFLAVSWSPFLVSYTVLEVEQLWKMQLDKLDDAWTWDLNNFDYIILSTSNWWFRKSHYYKNGKLLHTFIPDENGDIRLIFKALEEVWATVTKKLAWQYRGFGILRTVSQAHFEENAWNKGGTCNRTRPNVEEMENGNEDLPWTTSEIYKIERTAVESTEGRVKLLDVTYNTLWRADGHPSQYRKQKRPGEIHQDCTHWCLPGPIDAWNQLLFQLVLPSCAEGEAAVSAA